MIIEFTRVLEEANIFDELQTTDMFNFLNRSQEAFVKDKFFRETSVGFEENPKRSEELNTLVVKSKPITPIKYRLVDNKAIDYVDEPLDLLALIYTSATIDFNKKGIQTTTNTVGDYQTRFAVAPFFNMFTAPRQIQQDDILRALVDPFNSPSYKNVIYTRANKRLDFYTDETFKVSTVNVTYLKHPLKISPTQECELPTIFHRDVVFGAASLYISLKTQTSQPNERTSS